MVQLDLDKIKVMLNFALTKNLFSLTKNLNKKSSQNRNKVYAKFKN